MWNMKAVILNKHGGPEVLEYVEYPTPEPGAGQVLVRLHPLDDSERWKAAEGYRDRVVLCQPFQHLHR